MNANVLRHYEQGIGLLEYATEGLSEGDIRAPVEPGAWSIAELVYHVADSELVLADRMKRLIAEEQPVLMAFDETRWTRSLVPAHWDLTLAARLHDDSRRWMSALLRHQPDSALELAGTHTERGPVTLAIVLAGAVNHLDHHLEFLYRKRATLGKPLAPRFADPDKTS